jgi:hypothetical protein
MRHGPSYGLANLLVTPFAASETGWHRERTKSPTCGPHSCWPRFWRFFLLPSFNFILKQARYTLSDKLSSGVIDLHSSSKTSYKKDLVATR